ncbi:cytochrome p450 domain-containing protein [Ditylenchus destructor]|uniref:Cytochrome p450 domain-containing protein n=1 Tax=Ditylenchus destructor TaxID=166010 RepID=A0AAD4MXV3_9BILA|nr:cytochrome p450 domain-containing protein [Ditylenchus destructor]
MDFWIVLESGFYVLLLFASFLVVFYLMAVHRTKYWARRKIAGPSSRPFFGNMTENGHIALSQIQKWTQQFGKVYGVQEGWINVLVISDLELLHQIFTAQFDNFVGRKHPPLKEDVDSAPRIHVFDARGDRWKKLRRIALTALSTNIKHFLPLLDASARSLLCAIEESFGQNSVDSSSEICTTNIHKHLQAMSTEILTRIALGQRDERDASHMPIVPAEYLATTEETFNAHRKSGGGRLMNILNLIAYMIPCVAPLWRTIADFVIRWIGGRHKSYRGQFPSLCEKFGRKIDIRNLERKWELDEVFYEEVMKTIGIDTVTDVLACIFHELSNNSEVQRQVRAEIYDICGGEIDQKPSYEQLHAMRYPDAVIKETLRLFPLVAFASSRTCCNTTKIGSYTIEKGTTVQADVFSIHRDPHIFGPDPDSFRPERWLNENGEDDAKQRRLSWMGFGTGPRTCVGMRFAYMEMKIALIYLVRKFKILPNTEKSVLKLIGSSVLAPEAVFVQLQRYS